MVLFSSSSEDSSDIDAPAASPTPRTVKRHRTRAGESTGKQPAHALGYGQDEDISTDGSDSGSDLRDFIVADTAIEGSAESHRACDASMAASEDRACRATAKQHEEQDTGNAVAGKEQDTDNAEAGKRSTGPVVLKPTTKRIRHCGFRQHQSTGPEGGFVVMLGPDGKVLKHTTKCGVAHCSYSNHCNLCSDMSPGSEHRDVSNHHASCPVWLALTTPPDVADKASPFVPGAELNNFLCTLSCGGEHVPVSYFTALVAAFKRLADFAGGQIQCKVFLVMEVGGTQVFRHLHWFWQVAMPTDARERNAYAKAKAWVHSTLPPRRAGEKRILQIKPCATNGAKDVNGTVKYLCKDYGKDTFRYFSTWLDDADVAEVSAEPVVYYAHYWI